ncbi:MAG: hypothetical protein ACI39W_07780 [Brotaphodocola sp.]
MKQNVEFERCIDFLVRMLDKYGEEMLRELEKEKKYKEQKKMKTKRQLPERIVSGLPFSVWLFI